jgi:ADP-ribose pyrophosphatase YjhB (NUDIX family)
MDLTDRLRVLGDQLRSITAEAAYYANRIGDIGPYDLDRYERVRSVAAELYALVDVRPADEIERELFSAVTHIAPAPCVDAAVFDDTDRILLIRRADDGRWAMPGGALQVGETPAEGARRETREETGIDVEVVALAGVWDSRLCGSRAGLHLYHFVFEALPKAAGQATTPHEVAC